VGSGFARRVWCLGCGAWACNGGVSGFGVRVWGVEFLEFGQIRLRRRKIKMLGHVTKGFNKE